MDTITQGLLGAAAAQALLTRRVGPRAWLYGALGGMAPDLDIFIRSSTDPIVGWEYHRHFTHAIAFIPIGGLLTSLPWVLRRRFRPQARAIVWAFIVGYATHGLLDCFTSYGTQMLRPFSDTRVSWDFVAIIDPLFSLALLVGVWLSRKREDERPARWALAACALYLTLGAVQHRRAVDTVLEVAEARGHIPSRVRAMPLPGSNVLWRTIYEAGGRVHADSVRAPWISAARLREGSSAALVRLGALPPEVGADPRTARAADRFLWFADGWVVRVADDALVLGDARFSRQPGGVTPMWGVRLHPAAPRPTSGWRSLDGLASAPGDLLRDIFFGW